MATFKRTPPYWPSDPEALRALYSRIPADQEAFAQRPFVGLMLRPAPPGSDGLAVSPLQTALDAVGGGDVTATFDLGDSDGGAGQSNPHAEALSCYHTLRLRDGANAGEAIAAMHRLDGVVLAWPACFKSEPACAVAVVDPPTPDLLAQQLYLNGRSAGGLAIRQLSGWPAALHAKGTCVAVVDDAWHANHEDLTACQTAPTLGIAVQGSPTSHGTATVAVILADAVPPTGVVGMAAGAELLFCYPHAPPGQADGTAAVLGLCLARLQPGDVVAMPRQLNGMPMESDPAVFAAVAQLTLAGICVVAAAGNGPNGLEASLDQDDRFNRTLIDSGAILVASAVGASEPERGTPAHSHLNGNYGQRVDAHAWGQGVVTAAADSGRPLVDIAPDGANPDRGYTENFSHTSSACAQVAGAVALISAVARRLRGTPMTPQEMRERISSHGVRWQGKLPIGWQPDAAATLAGIRRDLFAGPAPAGAPSVALSSKRKRVLRHLGMGLDASEIAPLVGRSVAAVQADIDYLVGALQATDWRQAVWHAACWQML